MRISFGVVFFWFGILKPLGLSPAEGLVHELMVKMSLQFPGADHLYKALAILEMTIGVCFFFRKTLRLAIGLLLIHMPLTMLPLVLLPKVTFVHFPWVPTMEGQYILKNFVFIGASLVLGGRLGREVPSEARK